MLFLATQNLNCACGSFIGNVRYVNVSLSLFHRDWIVHAELHASRGFFAHEQSFKCVYAEQVWKNCRNVTAQFGNITMQLGNVTVSPNEFRKVEIRSSCHGPREAQPEISGAR